MEPPPAAEGISPEPPPLPGPAVVAQRWVDLVFLHWPYRPADVQALLPSGVSVDTHDGMAWIALVPFEMHGLRPVGAPPVPGLRRFVEINVRTYAVDSEGRRAVWFFSLDVPNPLMPALARASFGAPYCLARAIHATEEIDGHERHGYAMTRRWPSPAGASAVVDIEVGAPMSPAEIDPLAHFLTARWAALTSWAGRILRSPVVHEAWPLHRATCLRVEQDIIQAVGLPPPAGEPLTHFSPGVAARFSRPRRVAGGR